MTTKINGFPKEGVWFERDVAFLKVATTASAFSTPWGVDGAAEVIIRVLETRGTVIGVARESNTVCHFIFGHAAALNTATLAELKGVLDGTGNGTFTLTLGTSFATV